MQFDYNLVSFSWKKNQPIDLNTINTIENLKIKFKCFGIGVWWLKKYIRMEEGLPLKHTKAYKGGGENWQFLTVHTFWMGPVSTACFFRVQVFKICTYGLFVNIFKWDWLNDWSFLKWYSLPLILLQNIVLVYKTRNFQFFQKNKNLDYKLNTVTKTNAKTHTAQKRF